LPVNLRLNSAGEKGLARARSSQHPLRTQPSLRPTNTASRMKRNHAPHGPANSEALHTGARYRPLRLSTLHPRPSAMPAPALQPNTLQKAFRILRQAPWRAAPTAHRTLPVMPRGPAAFCGRCRPPPPDASLYLRCGLGCRNCAEVPAVDLGCGSGPGDVYLRSGGGRPFGVGRHTLSTEVPRPHRRFHPTLAYANVVPEEPLETLATPWPPAFIWCFQTLVKPCNRQLPCCRGAPATRSAIYSPSYADRPVPERSAVPVSTANASGAPPHWSTSKQGPPSGSRSRALVSDRFRGESRSRPDGARNRGPCASFSATTRLFPIDGSEEACERHHGQPDYQRAESRPPSRLPCDKHHQHRCGGFPSRQQHLRLAESRHAPTPVINRSARSHLRPFPGRAASFDLRRCRSLLPDRQSLTCRIASAADVSPTASRRSGPSPSRYGEAVGGALSRPVRPGGCVG